MVRTGAHVCTASIHNLIPGGLQMTNTEKTRPVRATSTLRHRSRTNLSHMSCGA